MKLQKPTFIQMLPVVFLGLYLVFKNTTHLAFLESALLVSFCSSLDEMRKQKTTLVHKIFLIQIGILTIGGLFFLRS